jgi:hypothetical protein
MLRKISFLGLVLPAIIAFAGCNKAHKEDAAPAPACYSGVVLRDRCLDGLLIQVDQPYNIGKTLPNPWADSLGTDNVIVSVNSLGNLGVRGQRIYFTYTNDPARQTAGRACTTFEAAVPLPVPHFVLSNVSANPCRMPWQ